MADGQGEIFTIEDYQVPSDPNHLMFYVWEWFAQAGGGRDEVIRHALAGEVGNDLIVSGQGYTGNERYRVSTWNRSQKRFTNLIYSSGGSGKTPAEVRIPATVQEGKRFNHAKSRKSFQGEGFRNGSYYKVDITTKNINPVTGEDEDVELMELGPYQVRDGILSVKIPRMNKFTRVDFIPSQRGKGKR